MSNFKIGDTVLVGLLTGVIVRIFEFHFEQWAEVKIDGYKYTHRLNELQKVKKEAKK